MFFLFSSAVFAFILLTFLTKEKDIWLSYLYILFLSNCSYELTIFRFVLCLSAHFCILSDWSDFQRYVNVNLNYKYSSSIFKKTKEYKAVFLYQSGVQIISHILLHKKQMIKFCLDSNINTVFNIALLKPQKIIVFMN